MASSTTTATPAFVDSAPGVLSIIGVNNVLVGLMVAGITGEISVPVLVPIVNSAAVGLANGLDYYNYLGDHPGSYKAAVSVFADLAWLIQEAGLSFYSYAILTCILRDGKRIVFLTLFWTLMLVIAVIKVIMIVIGVHYYLDNFPALSLAADQGLHIGYYLTIAVVECVGAVFLLMNFHAGLRSSMSSPLRGGKLYRYLMRSTEIRVATIALIGISRTVTYSFHTFEDWKGVTNELDRFVYSVECLFPIVLYIDILASRLVFANESNTRCQEVQLGSL